MAEQKDKFANHDATESIASQTAISVVRTAAIGRITKGVLFATMISAALVSLLALIFSRSFQFVFSGSLFRFCTIYAVSLLLRSQQLTRISFIQLATRDRHT